MIASLQQTGCKEHTHDEPDLTNVMNVRVHEGYNKTTEFNKGKAI